MIDLVDVFYALIKEFKKCVPSSSHYFGAVPEKFKRPSFLYLLVFNADYRANYFTKDTTLDVQIIYFGETDGYTVTCLEDKLKVMSQLKAFLGSFNLYVKDRNLKFDYNFDEADEELSVNIQFKFKDGIVNKQYDEAQSMEMMERIFINEKEVV